jgi:predicted uridylate kinase
MPSPEHFLSLGGSLLVQRNINTGYMHRVSEFLRERALDHQQYTAIVTGGGSLARKYQNAMEDSGVHDQRDKDEVGIQFTRANARLFGAILRTHNLRVQYVRFIERGINTVDYDAWITGGQDIGGTTDVPAVQFALKFDGMTVINATKISHVFDVLPDKTLDLSRPIDELSWYDYFVLLQKMGITKHQSGENLPFGFTASEIAMKYGLTAIIVNGKNLTNLRKVYEKRSKFDGTIIHP